MEANRLRPSLIAGLLLLAGSGLAGAWSPAALAAPVASQGPDKAGAGPSVTPVAAVTEAEEDSANCSRSRRRLWVEGEGWIVRRVTTCR